MADVTTSVPVAGSRRMDERTPVGSPSKSMRDRFTQ
jgi:hypothetical protein